MCKETQSQSGKYRRPGLRCQFYKFNAIGKRIYSAPCYVSGTAVNIRVPKTCASEGDGTAACMCTACTCNSIASDYSSQRRKPSKAINEHVYPLQFPKLFTKILPLLYAISHFGRLQVCLSDRGGRPP